MKQNMGTADRIIRTSIALIVGILFFTSTIIGIMAFVLIIFAVTFLLTSMMSTCPLYIPLTISTRKKESRKVLRNFGFPW